MSTNFGLLPYMHCIACVPDKPHLYVLVGKISFSLLMKKIINFLPHEIYLLYSIIIVHSLYFDVSPNIESEPHYFHPLG